MLDEELLVGREVRLEGAQVTTVHGAAEGHEVGQVVLEEELGRGELSENHPHGDEVAQDEPLVLGGVPRAVGEGVVELLLRLCELRVEHGESAHKVLVRNELRDREAAALDGLPVEGLGEAGALDRADQVLAQAQVVELKVDLEEVVDHVERAPLLRLLQLCPVGHLVRPRG